MRVFWGVLVWALAAGAVSAEDWNRYQNPVFGYGVEIPNDYRVESETVGGIVYRSPDGHVALIVAGAPAAKGFESEFLARLAADQARGYRVSEQVNTPAGGQYRAFRGQNVLATRAVPTCDGAAVASVSLVYGPMDMVVMAPVTARVLASLTGGSFSRTRCRPGL